jgi:type IV pilus assembly protein PilC
MAEFRIQGMAINGKPIKGIITAENYSLAKKKIQEMAKARNFTLNKIEKRKTYIYKIKKTDGKLTTGEQKAFSKDELKIALENLGYEVVSVQPKLLAFTMKPPSGEIVTFVRLSADLLKEKLPYNEVLQLLSNDIQNPAMREALKQINNDLSKGVDSEEAFAKQERTLGKFTVKMLGLASKSGNMVDIYQSTAKFLERTAEFRKNLRSALIMPLFTLLILIIAVFFYVTYIFPETALLFKKLGNELPPMTAKTLELSEFLSNNMFFITLVFLAISGVAGWYLSTPKGKFYKDQYILKVPMIGSLIHKTTIEIFCRVFHALYSGSGENVDAIKIAAEACGNRYMEHQIKNVAIPMMLSQGKGLVEGFEASGVFTETALSRFHSGAETGTVKKSAMQIANYYENETVYKLKNIIDFIQLAIAMIIMVVITALTLVSSEAALIKPKTPY